MTYSEIVNKIKCIVTNYININYNYARPFYKSGDVLEQATNSTPILSTDSIVHLGKVNIGADETTMPFNTSYNEQIYGNLKVDGAGFFNTNINYNRENTKNVVTLGHPFVYVDIINGINGLDPYLYYGLFGGTQSKFLTLGAAIDFANGLNANKVTIVVENTTNVTRAILDGGRAVMGKEVLIQGISNILPAYIDVRTFYLIQGGIASFVNTRLFTVLSTTFTVAEESRLNLTYSEITLTSGSTRLISSVGGDVYFDAFKIIFGANNQILVHYSGNNGGEFAIGDHTPITNFVTGSYTGLKFAETSDRNIILRKFENIIIPSNLDMSGVILLDGDTLVLKQTTYDSTNNQYGLVAGTSKPIRTPNMTSSSVNKTGTLKIVVVDENGVFGVKDL